MSYVVGHTSKFNNHPMAIQVSVVKQILKYIKKTIGCRITYRRTAEIHKLTAYCDANYASDLDDNKSKLGFILMLNRDQVAWKNKK